MKLIFLVQDPRTFVSLEPRIHTHTHTQVLWLKFKKVTNLILMDQFDPLGINGMRVMHQYI